MKVFSELSKHKLCGGTLVDDLNELQHTALKSKPILDCSVVYLKVTVIYDVIICVITDT